MVSDVGRKIRGGCELLVFYCSSGVICDVVVLSFERLLYRRGVYNRRDRLRSLLNDVHGDSRYRVSAAALTRVMP